MRVEISIFVKRLVGSRVENVEQTSNKSTKSRSKGVSVQVMVQVVFGSLEDHLVASECDADSRVEGSSEFVCA